MVWGTLNVQFMSGVRASLCGLCSLAHTIVYPLQPHACPTLPHTKILNTLATHSLSSEYLLLADSLYRYKLGIAFHPSSFCLFAHVLFISPRIILYSNTINSSWTEFLCTGYSAPNMHRPQNFLLPSFMLRSVPKQELKVRVIYLRNKKKIQ